MADTPADPTPPPADLPPPERRARSVLGLAALALTVALGGGGYAIAKGRPTDAPGPAAGPVPARTLVGAATANQSPLGDAVAVGATVTLPAGARVALGGPRPTFTVEGRAEVRVDGARSLYLSEGTVLAEGDEGPLVVTSPKGPRLVGEGRFAVTALEGGGIALDVFRGAVAAGEREPITLRAGEQGIFRDGHVTRAPLRADPSLAALAYGDGPAAGGDEVRGLGELRARKAGAKGEGESQLRLARHAVTASVAGLFAKTTVEEEFVNESGEVLEGIYRFPLPAGARVEQLAMEVDGRWMEGAWVPRTRGHAILDGALAQAAPKPVVPRDEIIWVRGPWRDPALLDASRGRFELRVYPIAARSRKRIRITYTEQLPLVRGERRYVAPLPHGTTGRAAAALAVAVQVAGAAGPARGDVLQGDAGALRFEAEAGAPLPPRDPSVRFSAVGDDREVSAWTYRRGDEAGFFGLALRPNLNDGAAAAVGTPESVVFVVDRGRAMVGARFDRARAVVARVAEAMDRRSEVGVLYCDVRCEGPKGELATPGPLAASALEAFGKGQRADGATDLVEAVAEAVRVPGRAGLPRRVVVLSGGVIGAGYGTGAGIEAALAGRLSGARVDVLAIGVDADRAPLQALARAGEGALLEGVATAEEAALATLGALASPAVTGLSVTLPDGLLLGKAPPPRVLPSGEELLLFGRLPSAGAVEGSIVVRGRRGGVPFERKIPLRVAGGGAEAATNASARAAGGGAEPVTNAFLPRAWAAGEIAYLDGLTTPAAEKEAIALSTAWAVPSRHSALLVLESEAMMQAFGVKREARDDGWTGTEIATDVAGGAVDRAEAPAGEVGSLGGAGLGAGAGFAPAKKAAAAGRASADEADDRYAQPPPAPQAAPAATSGPLAESKTEARRRAPVLDRRPPPAPGAVLRDDPLWNYVPMRRTWRKSLAISDAIPDVKVDELLAAQRAVDGVDPDRTALLKLFGLLARDGRVDGQATLLERWAAKDPLDADLLRARAALREAEGDLRGALRAADGIAASPMSAGRELRAALADLAQAHEALGDRAACAFRIALAEQPGPEAERVEARARAARCEHDAGHGALADRLLGEDEALATKVRARYAALADTLPATTGDLRVAVRSDGEATVVPSVVDPKGRRLSLVTAGKGIRGALVVGGRSELGLAPTDAGAYVIEVAGAAGAATPVTVTVTAGGATRSFPVVLRDGRARVAAVTLRWEEQLVPVTDGAPRTPPLPTRRPPLYLE